MAWVFDVSLAMAWCFEDERTPESDALLDRLKKEPAYVPQLWHLEVANILIQAMRQKKPRITQRESSQFLGMLAAAPIHIDTQTFTHAWNTTMDLANQYRLSAYDAAYLELAMRMGSELATLDRGLRNAAVAAGVQVIP